MLPIEWAELTVAQDPTLIWDLAAIYMCLWTQ